MGAPLPAIIFDCDGVLIDSETIACRVLSDALAGEGILISAEEIAERYVGLTGNAIFADLQARTGRSVREGFRERTHPRLAAAFEAELQPMRGVAALLASLVVGLLNVVLWPLLALVTLPFTLVTFGLFLFVVNALVLKIGAALTPGFVIEGLWPAVLGGMVLALLGWLLGTKRRLS